MCCQISACAYGLLALLWLKVKIQKRKPVNICRHGVASGYQLSWNARGGPCGGRWAKNLTILPRCMEYRRGLAMRILSVSLSVCLWFVTKRKKVVPVGYKRPFILVLWQEERWWGQLLIPEIVGQTDRVGAKSPIFDIFSLGVPQP